MRNINLKNILQFVKKARYAVFVIALTLASAQVSAQTKSVSINANAISLKEAIGKIEKQTSYLFIYDNMVINLNKSVAAHFKNEKLETVLNELFKGTDIRYVIEDRNIILIRQGKDLPQTPQRQIQVSGHVLDKDGKPLPGISVGEQGVKNNQLTGSDGQYSIKVKSTATLLFSHVSYESVAREVNGQSSIDIVLANDAKNLEEVVVIGYGAVKKGDLTGAVSQIKAKDLPQTGNMSLGQMMSGKASGLQVSQTSAQPGSGVWIQIRGNASGGAGNSGPLYVIDGYPISAENMEPGGGKYSSGSKSPLNNLNPGDIESIEILKDAAATAIYGARAANGVVLITTKRGKNGERATVQYSGSMSTQKKVKQIEMLNAWDFMKETNRVIYENWLSNNRISPYGNIDPGSVASPYVPKYSEKDIANAQNTDWLGAVERDGRIAQHNLSLRGGTEQTSYYVSGSIFDQLGVIKNNGIKRYSGRANFDQKLGKFIKTGINLNISQVNNANVALSNGQNENAGVIRAAMSSNPSLPIYDKEGKFLLDPNLPFLPNAVSLLDVSDQNKINGLLGNFYLTVTPVQGLDVKMNAGFQQEKGERNTYMPKTTLYGLKEGGQATRAFLNRSNELFDLTASYVKTIADRHTISAMGGYSYQHFSTDGVDAGNSRFITDAFLWNNLGAGESIKPRVGSYANEEILGSVFSRLNYNYDDRYLVSATIRGDASSKFAKNHKWGYFPSVALAWRIINENFMKEQKVVSDLKWRVSFGQTGNSNIGANSLALYSTGSNYIFGDQSSVGVSQSQLANPDLKWETTTELNLGLDFGFFKNRITGSVEFFTRRVSDLLDTKVLMQYNPINTVMANIGAKGSKGFELGIGSRNLTGDFKWSTDFTFSLYRDRWLERNPQWKKAIYENAKDMLNPYYIYLSDGLVRTSDMNPDGSSKLVHMPNAKPGMIKYKDVNGRGANGELVAGADGKLDDADIVYLGTRTSKFHIGFGNTFEYKNFDLNVFFYGYFGRKLDPPAYLGYVNGSDALRAGSNMADAVKNRWTHDHQNGKYPTSVSNPYERPSDFWLENADFLRCKNITLGYTLPKIKRLGKVVQSLRLYSDIQNPFIITKYSGVDPEMDGIAAYPTQLTVSFGVNVIF
ncbi:TonB-linked outer membrane protein, SusC/RagA family [Pedobacter steynii]|uniref:TonB-linked outer membrane protein, SusC/RagA family n=1 Tax=Pedobacter steynii TaxID=430522 RepID=A0A1H0G1X2_9SPHI|nr:TonB-dependent receptor [Pedobacter steynii]NQX42296.1 TonB-dependent receptor [Pedobacter steynii]SDO00918.1 TonB-linked outer membrane protein, SusC/RagA family [Pedobacter steynii]